MKIIEKPVNMVHLNMENSLQKILELEDIFDEMQSYMKYLDENKTVLQNFIQGELFAEQLQSFDKKDEIA